MMKCVKVLANDVRTIPTEMKHDAAMATLRYPKILRRSPLSKPMIIPKAAFRLIMSDPSVADSPISWKVSLNTSPKLCIKGMMTS